MSFCGSSGSAGFMYMTVCMPSWPLMVRIKLLPLSQTCAPGVVWLKLLGGGGSKHEVNLGFRVEVGRVGVFARWALRTLSSGLALDSLGTCRTGLALSACGTNGTRWASRALWPAAG